MLIDRISYRNSIKNINPIIKIFLAFIVLILILVTNNIELFIFNFIVANCIMLFIIKVKIKELIQLYAIPMFFILTTIISILWVKGDVTIFILRSMTSISVVYTLICSTPIIDFDYVFYKLKFPKIFRELFLLIYKYIFVLFDVKNKLLDAQKSRLGYFKYKNSIKSFSILAVSILRKTEYYSSSSYKAMESRLGKEFLFLHRKYDKIGKELWLIYLILIINLFLVVKIYA